MGRLWRRGEPAASGEGADEMAEFPLTGFDTGRVDTPLVEILDDAELAELNRLLRWHCFTVDQRGRRFGRPSSPRKRTSPQTIPDPRIAELDRRFGLAGASVLEVGCFEGVHTIALARAGAQATAIDSRVENVVKTIVRTAMFGVQANVFKCDVERDADLARLEPVDILHHVGVLYHLADPVTHLQRLLPLVRRGLLLDTHFATDTEATEHYDVGGRSFSYMRAREHGVGDVFSGMYDHSKWLTLGALHDLLAAAGFGAVDVAETRAERNGSRLTLYAAR